MISIALTVPCTAESCIAVWPDSSSVLTGLKPPVFTQRFLAEFTTNASEARDKRTLSDGPSQCGNVLLLDRFEEQCSFVSSSLSTFASSWHFCLSFCWFVRKFFSTFPVSKIVGGSVSCCIREVEDTVSYYLWTIKKYHTHTHSQQRNCDAE